MMSDFSKTSLSETSEASVVTYSSVQRTFFALNFKILHNLYDKLERMSSLSDLNAMPRIPTVS